MSVAENNSGFLASIPNHQKHGEEFRNPYIFTRQGIERMLGRHGFKIAESESDCYGGFFFVLSHALRFAIRDPHNCRSYNPLLYIHALLCLMSKVDDKFKLRYPNVYTGTEVIVTKK